MRSLLVAALTLLFAVSAGAAAPDWSQWAGLETVEVTSTDEDGAPRHTTVWIVVIEGEPFIRGGTTWTENVEREGKLKLKGAPGEYALHAEKITEPSLREAVIAAFREKYGTTDAVMEIFRFGEPRIFRLTEQATDGETRLFAYGTLLVPEVMEIVAGRRFTAERARLTGYRQRLLRGAVYPAVLPAPLETTPGLLYHALDSRALARIDRFEGELYERSALSVALEAGGACQAFVYVLRLEHHSFATDAAFDLEAFRTRHLRDYLVACHAFARELGEL